MSPSRNCTRAASVLGAFALIVGLLLGLALPLAGAAYAADSTTAKAADTAAANAPVLVVLDASGSMRATDAPGSRIGAAKAAVTGLVDSLPGTARVGLEVYGASTGSAAADKPAGCRDVKVVVPVATIHRDAFRAQVAAIRASGYTPIGAALRRAAAALPAEGARSIVLVSDGEDTCAPPQPCAVARELHRQGVDLTVHTVGFKVNPAARAQLQCIARTTGGSYRDAADGPSLSTTLNGQVTRALRGYHPVGTPVRGGITRNDAPQLQPGQYVDSYADAASDGAFTGTQKFYRIELATNETPYFSATVVPPAKRSSGAWLQVTVSISPLDTNVYCAERNTGWDFGVGGDKVSASTATVAPGRIGGASCLPAGPAIVTVSRAGNAFADEPLPVELAFHVEPAADATGLTPPAVEHGNLRADVVSAARPLDSGASFNDAPEIGTGTFHDSFTSGETRFVRVHLDWGQRLAYSIAPQRLPRLGVVDGVAGYSTLVNPVRQALDQANGAQSSAAFLGWSDDSLYGSTTVPVRYNNRHSADSQIARVSLAGDYYLALSTAFSTAGDAAITVPYTLKIAVTGARERGPVYGRGAKSTLPTHSTGPTTATSSSPPSTVTSSGPKSPGYSAVADRSSSRGMSTPIVAGAAAGGAALLACLAGALVLRRRNGRPQHGGSGPIAVWPGDRHAGGENSHGSGGQR